MSITRPQTLGGTISASDSDAISDELDAGGLPPGTVVWNIDVGAFFKLTASSATLVTDEILAVLNTDGARWIVETSLTVPVTNADLATMATHTFKANITAGTAVPTDITRTELTAELNVATPLLKGLQSTGDKSVMPRSGANLTDANLTINPGSDKCSKYILPAGTLTANRILIIGNGGAVNSDIVQVTVRDQGAFQYTIRSGDGVTVLVDKPANSGQAITYQFYWSTGGTQYAVNTQWWSE